MTLLRYILTSLWQYRRVHLAVAAGVAVATAVITGALLVGDSVRGSLQRLVLQRLGSIDQVLVAEQPFRAALADELGGDETAPLLLVPGTLATTKGDRTRRATQLSVIGHTGAFWQFASAPTPAPLTGNQVALSRSIAAELNISVGDEVLLRVPLTDNMPADSLLGEKAETTTARRLEVGAVLPDEGLARFSLRPSQQPPRNVFLPLATLQKLLALPGRANAIAIAGNAVTLRPTLDDYSIGISAVMAEQEDSPSGATTGATTGASAGATYLRITADRLVLPPALVSTFNSVIRDTEFPSIEIQPAVTYLANTIKKGDHTIPYSTITGVDSLAEIGPLLDDNHRPLVLADDEIVLNDWAANDLGAQVGDEVTITYYEPETTHGVLREGKPLTLKLLAIVPLRDAQGRSTLASDPQLTPDLPGVTDQRSISDWDLPFELVELIRRLDEDYWEEYATTPKAFVSYALAKRLWSTRWGTDSILRIPASANLSGNDIRERVRPDPTDMGMTLLPVKQQGLAAARGTTAFEELFLGFSFFLMASAVMLIALLFRLGVEGRATELGVLSSVGWSAARIRHSSLCEAALVAVLGAALGIAVGIGYARLMIHGLSTWWVAATVTPFLELHIAPQSLPLGFAVGLLVSLLAIAWSLRKLMKLSARQLLAGDCTDPTEIAITWGYRWLPPTLIAVALALGGFALRLEGEAQAGAFLGSGALVLTALLTWLRQRIGQPKRTKLQTLSLAGLARRNVRRYPARTILSVGLAAVASFLIVGLSAFRLAPTEQGTGGFELIATSDQPLHFDLNTSAGREEFGFDSPMSQQLASADIYSFRVRAGEDASCLNLYQTTQPQIVGVPSVFYQERQFGWSAAAEAKSTAASPWELLATDYGTDEAGRPIVAVVLDKNTAVYSLHLSGLGARMTINDAFDQSVTLEVIGLLSNSVLQGKLLISEANFLRMFPNSAGQQLFLLRPSSIHTPSDQPKGDDLATLLETELEDYGFDVVSTEAELAGFLAVQNTYLSTFQSLGALGLLLGTLGLAVAQLRSVLERRGELALLRSTGFRRSRLGEMILGENTILLLAGLGIGTLAALVAVLPHYFLQAADTPWTTLFGLLAIVLVAGLLTGWLAVRAAARAPLLPALRGD